MAMRLLIEVLMFVTFSLNLDTTDAVTVKYYCLHSTGSDFKFVVRLKKDGDNSITGITAVDASVTKTISDTPTESSCVSNTEESPGIFALSADVDVDALPCGIESGGGTVYNIQILATGTSQYYTFSCDTGNLLQATISIQNFATKGVTNVLHHRGTQYDVKFQVFRADDTYAPARTVVDLGQDIILRLIYNKGHLENGPDSWGTVFHTGFIEHHTATVMKLQIVTAGFGTSVHITGQLSGKIIDEWVVVKRDVWAEVEIPYPDYHITAATEKDWRKETRGIKIESLHDRIGVISKGELGGDVDQLVVFPDDILGNTYRPFQANSGGGEDDDQEVVIVATKDSSSVTIKYNMFNIPGGLKVAGANVNGGDADTTFTLDEYDVLHIYCDDECASLEISSTENIGVVSGWEDQRHEENNNKGFSSAQIIPTNYYGDEYVFVESLLGETSYFIQNDDPTDTTLKLSDDSNTNNEVGSPYYLDWKGDGQSEVTFNEKVSVYMYTAASNDGTPALVQYPSVSQWGIYNSFPVQEGITYSITIVTTKGDTAGIKVSIGGVTTSFTGATLGAGAGFAAMRQDVSKLATAGGGAANYEVYTNEGEFSVVDQQPALTERGFIEFTASETSKPFMLLVFEVNGNAQSLHLPLGVRFPPQNPCIPTPTKPGDIIDNDCDGKVDEDPANGVDDDGDSEVDEDLPVNTGTSIFQGIYVKDLLVDDNAAFISPTTVQTSGCNVLTPSTQVLSTILPFTRNTDLSDVFDPYWVIDTPAFNAFKFVGESTVYFRVTFDFCGADLTLCENSCQSVKKKRSVEDEDNFVDLMVEVHGNKTNVHIVDSNISDVIGAKNRDEGSTRGSIHQCANSAVLWLPATLLLAILLFEAVMTVVFMHTRSKFVHDL